MIKKILLLIIATTLSPILIVLVAAPFNLVTEANQNYLESTLLQQHSKITTKPFELKLMTYNIADAHGFTTNQRERVSAIADLLVELDVDIVGLQEVFIEKDRQFLYERLSSTELKYHTEYPAALVGNGLVVLSKFPIEESFFHRFKANNTWWKVWEGDWWAGKGIGLARVSLPNGAYIDFYNVHAQAYRGNTESEDVRLEQFKEASEFLNLSSLSITPSFFVGDFNTQQGKPDYVYAEKNSKLVRLMNIHSDIDHITAIQNPFYAFETLDTQEITGTTMGNNPGKFYSRAPTLKEFWDMHFGEPEVTALSDHPGYLSTIKISPVTNN